MSIDLENRSQAQNRSNRCGSIRNLENGLPVCNKEINEAAKSSFEIYNQGKPVVNKPNLSELDAEPVMHRPNALVHSKDNSNQEKQAVDKSVLSEPSKKNGNAGILENIKTSNPPLQTNLASENDRSSNVELFHENEVRKVAGILHCVVSTDKTSTFPYRPMAEMLIGIGTNAAMLHVCRDIVECLETNPNSEMSDDIRTSICKTKEAEKCLTARFKPYSIPLQTCRCGRKCHSKVELVSHKRIGWSTKSLFRCCLCSSFRTRSPALFVDHLCDEHGIRGTTEPSLKHACNFCPYENRCLKRLACHEEKCKSTFVLSRNLVLANNDIVVFGKPAVASYRSSAAKVSLGHGSPIASDRPARSPCTRPQRMPGNVIHGMISLVNNHASISLASVHNVTPKNSPSESTNLSASLAQMLEAARSLSPRQRENFQSGSPTAPLASRSRQVDARAKATNAGGPSCEICDASVTSLESLLEHMKQIHQVINVESIDFFLRGKAFVCKTCFQGFWTQLGLGRHRQLMHNEQSHPCFICGPVTSTDILTHLITKHNISLRDMLSFGWCYICKTETKTPDSFVDHMTASHPDLFPDRASLASMAFTSKGTNLRNAKLNDSRASEVVMQKAPASRGRPSLVSRPSPGRARHRCHPCQMRFNDEEQLDTHRRILHVVPCSRCDKKWTSVEAMNRHFDQQHHAEKDPCPLCGEMVKIGVPTIRHMKRVHLKKCVVLVERLSPSQRMKYVQLARRSQVRLQLPVLPSVVVRDCNVASDRANTS